MQQKFSEGRLNLTTYRGFDATMFEYVILGDVISQESTCSHKSPYTTHPPTLQLSDTNQEIC
jgi:hypothetical protein